MLTLPVRCQGVESMVYQMSLGTATLRLYGLDTMQVTFLARNLENIQQNTAAAIVGGAPSSGVKSFKALQEQRSTSTTEQHAPGKDNHAEQAGRESPQQEMPLLERPAVSHLRTSGRSAMGRESCLRHPLGEINSKAEDNRIPGSDTYDFADANHPVDEPLSARQLHMLPCQTPGTQSTGRTSRLAGARPSLFDGITISRDIEENTAKKEIWTAPSEADSCVAAAGHLSEKRGKNRRGQAFLDIDPAADLENASADEHALAERQWSHSEAESSGSESTLQCSDVLSSEGEMSGSEDESRKRLRRATSKGMTVMQLKAR
jgi:hypothetical protein